MVAVVRLRRLLEVLADNLADLKRYGLVLPPGSLARDRDRQHMVLHAMYLTTQAMIDAASHVVADRGLPRPTTYAAVFDRLAEAGVFDAELAQRLADWASMRNVLAHFYPVIDFERIEQAIREDLGDFDAFLKVMEGLLAGEEGGEAGRRGMVNRKQETGNEK
jgi:uncharacterized protein YutE (UPF0331/DUF86 family)